MLSRSLFGAGQPPAGGAANDASALRNKQDLKFVRIGECVDVLPPKRIGRNDLRLADPSHDRFDLRWAFEIEDEN
jgi:hypothetical protein